MRNVGIALAGALALAGCATAHAPIDVADQVTRAVYSDDLNGTVAHFDGDLRDQVKTADVDQLSKLMHEMGSYQKLSMVNADDQNRRYDYEANFDRGSVLVQMRFDPDGKVAAYRISPIQQ
ncbi:MAG TPA: hypothetical protein VN905_04425 [Candidatus Binatia bacterium]|nr:hypothetical protein [Candidatus Binatia bacterium]